jgi:hypothetical protein
VVGEFRRILDETTGRLRELEIASFAEELEGVAKDADNVSSAAAAVLDLLGSREWRGVLTDGEPSLEEASSTMSAPKETSIVPERLGAATEHLTAICNAILGRG